MRERAFRSFNRDLWGEHGLRSTVRLSFQHLRRLGCLVGLGLVISVLACVIMERRTRKQFVDREPDEDDWSFFDDDEDEGKD